MDVLKLWHYPGNVRELRNTVERAVALCEADLLGPLDLPERMLDLSLPPRKKRTSPPSRRRG